MLPRKFEIGICSPAVAIAVALSIVLLSLVFGKSDLKAGEAGAHAMGMSMTMPAWHQMGGMGGKTDRPCPQTAGAFCAAAVDLMAQLPAPRPFTGKLAPGASALKNTQAGLIPAPPRRPPRAPA